MFFNRYLDVSEAIDEKDSSMLDNADFEDVNLPSPYNMNMPRVQYEQKQNEEAIREDVLSWALDDDVDQEDSAEYLAEEIKICDSMNDLIIKNMDNKIRNEWNLTKMPKFEDAQALKQLQRRMQSMSLGYRALCIDILYCLVPGRSPTRTLYLSTSRST